MFSVIINSQIGQFELLNNILDLLVALTLHVMQRIPEFLTAANGKVSKESNNTTTEEQT
jgi:hypothetical protein